MNSPQIERSGCTAPRRTPLARGRIRGHCFRSGRGRSAVAGLVASLLLAAGVSDPAAARLPALPAGAAYGEYAVGVATGFAVDVRQRFDPWNTAYAGPEYRALLRRVEDAGQTRTVVFQLWYPAPPNTSRDAPGRAPPSRRRAGGLRTTTTSSSRRAVPWRSGSAPPPRWCCRNSSTCRTAAPLPRRTARCNREPSPRSAGGSSARRAAHGRTPGPPKASSRSSSSPTGSRAAMPCGARSANSSLPTATWWRRPPSSPTAACPSCSTTRTPLSRSRRRPRRCSGPTR